MPEAVVKKSSYKKLFSNTVIFAVGSFSSKVLILLLVKVYTSYLSREELGVNDVISQIANWLQPIVTMTISEAVIRFGLDKAYDKKKVFTLGNMVCLGGFAVLGIVLPIVAISGVADKYLSGYSMLLYVYVVMSGLKLVYSTFVRALEKVKLFAFNGILTTFLTLIGTIVFIIGFKMGNTGYLLSIIVSDGLSVVFLTFSAKLWRYLDFRRPDKELLSTMLKYSVPLIPAQVLWLITNSSDSFMTTHYLGSASNGVLSAAYKIPNLVATVYFMFGQAWNMSAIMEDDSDDRNDFYTNVFEFNQCLLFIIAGFCLLIVRPLTGIWLGPEFQDSAYYSPLLIFSSVFSCFVTFLGSIYLTSKRTMRSLATSLVSGIINIVLNIILIPRIGLYGPALSTVASYFTVFIIRAYDSRKIVPFDLKIKKLALNIGLLALMVIINHEDLGIGRNMRSLLLPALFVVIVLLNYQKPWEAMSKMLPRRLVKILKRLGILRILFLMGVLAGIIVLGRMTMGWLFYFIGALVLAQGVLLGKKGLSYPALALLFVSVWAEMSLGAAAFTAAVASLVMLAAFRSRRELLAAVIMTDICVGLHFGASLLVFVICFETVFILVLMHERIAAGIGRLLGIQPRKKRRRKKKSSRKKHTTAHR
ncbi:MAG: polysaccharide biosynthesis C-terminal domain-containing protein [Ruminococcus sp.]|nr:polysaccharide biosynthesis C-terminal domain-containing protein [Ruminococcus sp.]